MTFNYDLNFQPVVDDVRMMDVLVGVEHDEKDRHDHLNLSFS